MAIDVGSLAFTAEEIAQLLVSKDLEPSLGSTLADLTGGWPSAVVMCIDELSRTDAAQRDDVMASFTKASRPLYTYLLEEVLAAESPEVRRLIQVAAVLERFNPELCDG